MRRPPPRIPASVAAGLVLAVVLDTIIQIAWKRAVSGLSPGTPVAAVALGALSSPCFYAAMAAFAAQLYNWMRVLARADLSFAQPFTALSIITVLTLSSRLFHEHLSVSRLVGVGLILLGVFFVSRTPVLGTSHDD